MEYYQLNSQKREIRLLKLRGDKTSKHVECELKHYRLSSLHKYPYTAISYHWGDPKDTAPIIVDGVEVQVTRNLKDALCQLQADGYYRIWADAICIDQNDDEEKSEQILYMTTIYSLASEVVVWIGAETKRSKAVMEHMKSVDRSNKVVEDLVGSRIKDIAKDQGSKNRGSTAGSRYSWLEKTMDRGVDHLLELKSEDARAGLIEFFERPYWRRVWIIQEIVSASHVIVYCGQDHTEMVNINRLLARTPEGKEALRSGRVPDFSKFQAGPRGKSSSLLKLIMNSRASECTNARDKIYALRGISADGEKLIPTPDYNKSAEAIFEDFARTLLSEKLCGNILLLRPPDHAPEDCRRLPSWVPDWSQLSSSHRSWHSVLAGRDFSSSYSAEVVKEQARHQKKVERDSRYLVPRFTFYGKLLKVRGYIIDRVDGISTQYCDQPPTTVKERHRRALSNPTGNECFYKPDQIAWAIVSCIRMQSMDFGPHNTSWDEDGSSLRDFIQIPSTDNIVLRTWLRDNEKLLVNGQNLAYWIDQAKRELGKRGQLQGGQPEGQNQGQHQSQHQGQKPRERQVVSEPGLARQLLRSLGVQKIHMTLNGEFAIRTTKDADTTTFGRFEKVLQCGMRLATTQAGRIGMLHPQAQPRDLICCLPGTAMPILLRRNSTHRDETYNIVGEAYLHPITNWGASFLGLDLAEHREATFFIE